MLIELGQSIVASATRIACGISSFSRAIDINKLNQRLYFANHSSHFDFLAIWSSLPETVRRNTRPVAARDYWDRPGIRGLFSRVLFKSVFVDRQRDAASNADPLRDVRQALRDGSSVIFFPEGTRSLNGEIQDFRKGLYHLSVEFPGLELVPVYLDNLNRILPKGEFMPVPLLSRVIFGRALQTQTGEPKEEFLKRARESILALKL